MFGSNRVLGIIKHNLFEQSMVKSLFGELCSMQIKMREACIVHLLEQVHWMWKSILPIYQNKNWVKN